MDHSKSFLPNALVGKASGAVIDRRRRYIGLVIDGEEYSFEAPDLSSFDAATRFVSSAGVPIHEIRVLQMSFWLMVAAGLVMTVVVSMLR